MPQRAIHEFVERTKKGNRWAIADIHGCYNTFRRLLEVIEFKHNDQLFLLGDYIDKGRQAIEVLDFIIGLKGDGYQVFPVLGNHELNFLEAFQNYDERTFGFFVSRLNKNVGLVRQDGKPYERHIELFESLPFIVETDDFVMVHAAVKPGIDYSDTKYVIEQYKVDLTHEDLNGKTLLRGHQPTPFPEIEGAVKSRAAVLTLDGGCVYHKRKKRFDTTQLGKLIAFNLDTYELRVVENCEEKLNNHKRK